MSFIHVVSFSLTIAESLSDMALTVLSWSSCGADVKSLNLFKYSLTLALSVEPIPYR
jgi:hypothetical protein